jgi:hypothetical protein
MSAAQKNIFQPLDQTTQMIRLVKIFNTPNYNEIVSSLFSAWAQKPCIFEVFSFDICSRYTALSYTWGPPNPTASILIDGSLFCARENLHLALQAIRKRSSIASDDIWTSYPKFYCMDGLCINQDDVLERNRQVNLMSQIYSHASLVRIWLGPEAEDSNLAMDFLLSYKT